MNSDNSIPSKGNISGVCCAPFSNRRTVFGGKVLVILGALGLLSVLFPAQQLGRVILPVILLLWGGMLLLGARKTR